MKRHLLSSGRPRPATTRSSSSTPPRSCARVADRPIKKLPTLRGRTVVNLFFEDSTRTRISFEAAAKRLSADVINFSAKGSSVSKGESLKDTALTLRGDGRRRGRHPPRRLAARRTGWRHSRLDPRRASSTPATAPTSTRPRRCSTRSRCAGTSATLRRPAAVTIVGDVLHSRVARSNVLLLHTLGAEVTLVAPPTLLPVGVDDLAVRRRRTTSTARWPRATR